MYGGRCLAVLMRSSSTYYHFEVDWVGITWVLPPYPRRSNNTSAAQNSRLNDCALSLMRVISNTLITPPISNQKGVLPEGP